MAKLSISVPADLVEDLHALAVENVSAFVSTAIRHEVDRRRLFAFLEELEDELGPTDEEEVAAYTEALSAFAASDARTRRTARTKKVRSRSAS